MGEHVWSWGSMSGHGGACLVGGCVWWGDMSGGGCVSGPGSVSGQGGVSGPRGGMPGQVPPSVNRMTDRCKNITLAKTSFRPVTIRNHNKIYLHHSYLSFLFYCFRFLWFPLCDGLQIRSPDVSADDDGATCCTKYTTGRSNCKYQIIKQVNIER